METTADQASEDREGAPMPTLVGRLLDGRYRLDSVIARGGMATVYLANDTRLDRTVAVKVMHRALADDPEFVARFTREAKASARVSAPEVVAVPFSTCSGAR
jgi:serine/threonine protein kinase